MTQPPSDWQVVWTILKLKAVRALLAPLLRLHVWHELKEAKAKAAAWEEPDDPDSGPPDPADEDECACDLGLCNSEDCPSEWCNYDPECRCCLITSNPDACKCGCGLCCPVEE
jgi:hypothetical protein